MSKVKGCYVVSPSRKGSGSGGSRKSNKSNKSHRSNKSGKGCK